MQFGICDLSVIPVRLEPTDKSEMVTELIFGESCEILEQNKQWLKIIAAWDNYTGWIDNKQIQLISPAFYQQLQKEKLSVTTDVVSYARRENYSVAIPIGSTIPSFNNGSFKINEENLTLSGKIIQPEAKHFSGKKIEEYAKLFLSSPYLWGGRTPFGIDCSGFTQIVYKLMGYSLKRDAYQQAEQGIMISFIDEAHPGDLAFFQNEEGKITHTGIILPDKKIIHASGRVRIDSIDHYGIFNSGMKTYSHQLRVIKRIL